MDNGFFCGLFDLNHDEELDASERVMDFMLFDEISNDNSLGNEIYDNIEMAGLDSDKL